MNKVANINTSLMEKSHALVEHQPEPDASPWQLATTSQRDKAGKKASVIRELQSAVTLGTYRSFRKAANAWILGANRYGPDEIPLAFELGNGGNCVSLGTLYNWWRDYQQGGTEALLEGRGGSDPDEHEWHALALELWDQPTKPNAGDVVVWLRQRGIAVERHQVRRLIERKGDKYSKNRVGDHYWRQNIGPYVIRDKSCIPVGHTFMGDGHTCDVYVAHPRNGKSWRPELTVWIDWRSNYVVGWYISNVESAITTMACLSATIDFQKHVPAMIYVDPGSGFKNKIVTEEKHTSFCARMSITPSFALPGNAKAKGLVEGWFKHFESRCGKKFETHTSTLRTDSKLRNLKTKIKKGEIVLPTLEEYKEAIAEYVHYYNNNVQKELGCAPSALWGTVVRVDPGERRSELIKPHFPVTIRNGMVRRKKRVWRHELLAEERMHRRKVQIAIDLNDDSAVTVEDLDGRFLCVAPLYEKEPALPASFIEETERKRLLGQKKRSDAAFEKKLTQANLDISHETDLEEFHQVTRKPYSVEDMPGHSLIPTKINEIEIDPRDLYRRR